MRLLVDFRFAPHGATPLLAVRHAATVVELDGTWHESFASDCWLGRGKNAQVQFGHNDTVIGSVDVVAAAGDGWWYADGTIDTDDLADDTEVLARIRVGAPISLGFDPIHHDDDLNLRVRRHDLAALKHIAILRRGEIPAYRGAKIISIRKLADSRQASSPASSGGNWRSQLPRQWADFGNLSDETVLRPSVLTNRNGSIVWDGTTFVAAHHNTRIAA